MVGYDERISSGEIARVVRFIEEDEDLLQRTSIWLSHFPGETYRLLELW